MELIYFFKKMQKKRRYLPWPNFNNQKSDLNFVCKKALKLASKFYSNFELLSPASQKLIARNGYQILGKDLNDPVEFVLCWTPGGEIIGGAAQGIKIANFIQIPVFNLFNQADEALLHIENL
jgi:hypothetical protein